MFPEHPLAFDAPTEAETTLRNDATEPLAGPASEEQQLQPGTVLESRFRVVRLVGRGGMGEVYEAVDGALGTRVALKTMRLGQWSNDERVQRFRSEILLARKISHPNVCRVFELHVGGPGEPPLFLSMELLEGETLCDRLRREGHLAEPAARALVAQIASGLAAAHAEGVVHRDLKPSNIMLVPVHGGGERAVVTDFGIARPTDGLPSGSMTWDGPVGTPAYMAPEQACGGDATPATDLYSLGVLMYELTSGSLPCPGDTPQAIAFEPLWGSWPERRSSTPRTSKRWRELIRWCLAKDPARRPQSAEAFLRALRPETRPRRWASRRVLWGLALTSAAFAAVTVALRFGPGAPGSPLAGCLHRAAGGRETRPGEAARTDRGGGGRSREHHWGSPARHPLGAPGDVPRAVARALGGHACIAPRTAPGSRTESLRAHR